MVRPHFVLAPLTFLALTGFVHGGMSTGGAEYTDERANPWYLQNTAEVRYCIVHDPATFSLPLTKVRAQLGAAFSYWAQELRKVQPKPGGYLPPYSSIIVGTQSFTESACDQDTDLVFQLGSLTDPQRQVIDGDLRRIIGHTERTSYDEVQLKGRGFIYVAADQGSRLVAADLIRPAAWSWNEGSALYAVLTHELGHIYGLFDFGQNPSDIMSYTFAENVLQKVADYPDLHIPLYLRETVRVSTNQHPGLDSELPSDPVSRQWQERWLGLPLDAIPTVAVHYHDQTLQILGGPSGDQLRPIGEAKLSETVEDGERLISVWLPPRQQVFRYADPHRSPTTAVSFPIVHQQIVTAHGLYQPNASQQTTQIYVVLDPAKDWPPKILGVVGVKGIRDLLHYRADGPLPPQFP